MDLHVSSVTDRKARKSEQTGKESVFLRPVNENRKEKKGANTEDRIKKTSRKTGRRDDE